MALFGERWTFFREYLTHFHDTGAITPSSRFLARALTRGTAAAAARRNGRPLAVLEAGAGTGPFTRELLRVLEPGDELVCYELNERLARILKQQLGPVAQERGVALSVLREPVQNVAREPRFDAVVSGLPFNNFTPELVSEILDAFFAALKPGGTVSFFEYWALRRAKLLLTFGAGQRRLKGVDDALRERFSQHPWQTKVVPLNLPPAIAHQLTLNDD